MSQNIFKGLGIALITPFNASGAVDYVVLKQLVEYQLKNGADFFYILATTGETPTLTDDEKQRIKELVVEVVAGRVPILMGCGGNNTAAIVEELHTRDFSGIDGILSVCPYYNKPSQEGLYQHFKTIANATDMKVVLYNVPGRTGVNMTFPMIACGAVGVISVIGNALPKEFSRMLRLEQNGEFEPARKIHHMFTDLFNLLFVDGNPAGVKAMLHEMGMIENVLRLPLVPTRLTTMQKISECLKFRL